MDHPIVPQITPTQALELGWSIIPTNANKTPMLTSWKPYQTQRPTPEEFAKWCKWNPPAWAVITGAISDRIVFDFDGPTGTQTLQALQIEPHRQTPSGGYHIDFAHPGWHVASVNGKSAIKLGKRWPGLDIRGDGGYALFFGRTEKGQYQWLRDVKAHPLELLPKDLREFLGDSNKPAPTDEEIAEKLIEMALSRIPMQGRNAAGFWLATQLRDAGFTQHASSDILQKYRQRCPSTNRKGELEEYTEKETLASLDQAYSRPAREPLPTQKPAATTEGPVAQAAKQTRSHFLLTSKGVFFTDEESELKIFICSRLEVLAYARDTNSESWGRLLKWSDPIGKPHSWIVPMRMLVGDGLDFRATLADGGLEIGTAPKINSLLVHYVRSEKPERYIYCVPHTGWIDRAFVFPESVIPETADVGYQSLGRGEHFYRTSGTLESWQENVSRKCIGNSRLILALSAAFTGPLLRPLNVQGGGFHFRAISSLGKSTTQWIAGSVWGGGGRNGFARTWATTKNALESIAELHNDACLILDEIRMVDPREIEPIVYMLANGSGKARETRSMTGRRTLQWLCIILSSGEIVLSDCAALAGQKIKGGAEIRMATIPADAGAGLGIFEQLHDTSDPRVFAESLEAAAKQHYGTAIQEFLKRLVTNWERIIPETQQFIEKFIAHNLPKGSAAEVRRVLRRFAITAAAGEMATEFEITKWKDGDASLAAATCFQAWIEQKGGIEATDIQNAINQIKGILSSQRNRFRRAEPETTREGERISEHIHNALGYWKKVDGEILYLVEEEAFKTELCKGYDPNDIAEELYRRQFLRKNNYDRKPGYRTEVTPPDGEQVKLPFYAIRAKILEGG